MKNIPLQVQSLIDNLLNSTDNVYIRGNYRMRLDDIRLAINDAIRKYDSEVFAANSGKPKKKRA